MLGEERDGMRDRVEVSDKTNGEIRTQFIQVKRALIARRIFVPF